MVHKTYHRVPPACNNAGHEMTIASDLLQQHVQTLVDDNARWQTLIADNILWELAYAPSPGHPAQLSGRRKRSVTQHGSPARWRTSAFSTSRRMPSRSAGRSRRSEGRGTH